MSFPRCKFFRPGTPDSCKAGDKCQFLHDTLAPSSRRGSADRSGFFFPRGTSALASDAASKFKLTRTPSDDSAPPPVCPQPGGQSSSPEKRPSSPLEDDEDSCGLDEPASAYSGTTELSALEISSYKAKRFTLGSIPLLPPAAHLVD